MADDENPIVAVPGKTWVKLPINKLPVAMEVYHNADYVAFVEVTKGQIDFENEPAWKIRFPDG